MRLLPRRPAARRGFTLIEMVVVIAVIAVLVALVAGAVMNILSKGPAAQDRSDISALSVALQEFKAKYGFYPPSRIRLFANSTSYNPKNQTHVETLKAIGRMFSSMNWNNIDWTGNNNTPTPFATLYPKGILLEGDQCLVFFLGGIPTVSNGTNACTGFSKSTTNPAQPGGERLKFYDFQPARLTSIHGNPFFSYLNGYANKEYAYFSTGTRGQNQYNSAAGTGTGRTDCPTLGVTPYATTAGPAPTFLNPTFVNPDSFQLISAGQNGKFGQGLPLINNPNPPPAQIPPPIILWSATNSNNIDTNGRDDVSNFSDRILGETQ
jgi:prepilin-type N-terminal cleavage/methylation domain-containing protein